MARKPVVAVNLVISGILLYSCALFYPGIPPIEFRLNPDGRNLELNVLGMSGGGYKKREDESIVANMPNGGCDITFMVQSGSQTSQFVARIGHGSMTIKGVGWLGVLATYGFRGGMWIASRPTHDDGHYIISGVAASPTSFVVGRVLSGYQPKANVDFGQTPLIDQVAPNTRVQFDPNSPGVSFMGRGGASVFAEGFDNPGAMLFPGTTLSIYAPPESSVVIEQDNEVRALEVGPSSPLRVIMRPGRAKIRWFPVASEESHADVVIAKLLSDEQENLRRPHRVLSFSSMLDK